MEAADAFTRNLLIVHNATFQALSDWQEIAANIRARASEIDVQILSEELPANPFLDVWQASRPSLIVSPRWLLERTYMPRGGALYHGETLGKIEELERLRAAGLPVPETWLLRRLVRDGWGGDPEDLLIAKPAKRGGGKGVRLLKARDLPQLGPQLLTAYGSDTLVQRFIMHHLEQRPTHYRVLTLFGRALYCARHSWTAPRRPLDEIAATDGVIASNATADRIRVTVDDPDILDIAQRAADAFPEQPTLGIDMIRATETGELYVMEVNTGGRVWHLSSELAAAVPDRDHIRALYEQFGALSVAADALIDATRRLAK